METLVAMETCQRCHVSYLGEMTACPGCSWPAHETFPPHPPEVHHPNHSPDPADWEALSWEKSGTDHQIPQTERFNWGFAVLGFILPLVGLVYMFAGRKRNPAAAHAAFIGAMIGMFLLGFGGILEIFG